MPTGYTAFIEDGTITTAEDFLMLCARAMGATIEMRDEPLSKPIPKEFAPSTYHAEILAERRKWLCELQTMTDEEVEQKIEMDYAFSVKCRKEWSDRQEDIYAKYMAILDKVKNWTPPTPEHEGLKEFAIEQIEMCLPDMNFEYEPPVKLSVTEWREVQLAECLKDIERHKKGAQEEIERAESRNKWLKDLRESLGIE